MDSGHYGTYGGRGVALGVADGGQAMMRLAWFLLLCCLLLTIMMAYGCHLHLHVNDKHYHGGDSQRVIDDAELDDGGLIIEGND